MERKEIHELQQLCTRETQLTYHEEIHGTRRKVPRNKIYNQSTHSIEEGEQISTKPLQDKDHNGETLKTMKGAQGLTRTSRSGEHKDGEDKPFMSRTG
jgi:hypothetical protein